MYKIISKYVLQPNEGYCFSPNNYLGKHRISDGHPAGLDHWIRTGKEEPRYTRVFFFSCLLSIMIVQ